jgi:hypothetical protein
MKPALLEIRKLENETWQVFKNAKPAGKASNSDCEFGSISFDHPVFDLTCDKLPEIRLLFMIQNFPYSFSIIETTRKKRQIEIGYFITMTGSKGLYNLSEAVVLSHLVKNSKALGFKPDSEVNEDDPFLNLFKRHQAKGTLREKIMKDSKQLDKIKLSIEKQLIKKLNKGIMYSSHIF